MSEIIFMDKLAESGAVTDKVFSFYISDDNGSSYIDFGTANTSVYAETIAYISIAEGKLNWGANVTGFRIGQTENESTEYAMEEHYGYTSSAYSCISGPELMIDTISHMILNTADKVLNEWHIYIDN